ncbi:MAG: hypothetical protein R2719_14990 [Micropruina sp.]
MDAADQDFTFTCGVSLMVHCHGQDELNRYREQLSAASRRPSRRAGAPTSSGCPGNWCPTTWNS